MMMMMILFLKRHVFILFAIFYLIYKTGNKTEKPAMINSASQLSCLLCILVLYIANNYKAQLFLHRFAIQQSFAKLVYFPLLFCVDKRLISYSALKAIRNKLVFSSHLKIVND